MIELFTVLCFLVEMFLLICFLIELFKILYYLLESFICFLIELFTVLCFLLEIFGRAITVPCFALESFTFICFLVQKFEILCSFFRAVSIYMLLGRAIYNSLDLVGTVSMYVCFSEESYSKFSASC
jgi:hypothetical protein